MNVSLIASDQPERIHSKESQACIRMYPCEILQSLLYQLSLFMSSEVQSPEEVRLPYPARQQRDDFLSDTDREYLGLQCVFLLGQFEKQMSHDMTFALTFQNRLFVLFV